MDILRKSSESEVNFIIDKLKENLPHHIKDLHFMLAAKRSSDLSKNFSNVSDKLLPTFYTHRNGLKENCTVFGITGERDHAVWFFTLQKSLQEVTECLEKTKLIRWNERVLFVTVHKRQTQPVLDVIAANNYELQQNEDAVYYWLPKAEALKFDIT